MCARACVSITKRRKPKGERYPHPKACMSHSCCLDADPIQDRPIDFKRSYHDFPNEAIFG
jgi:hypothetical protein